VPTKKKTASKAPAKKKTTKKVAKVAKAKKTEAEVKLFNLSELAPVGRAQGA